LFRWHPHDYSRTTAIHDRTIGLAFAFANCALFMLYVVLGHRIANAGPDGPDGIHRLGAAMLIAAVAAIPWGLGGALPAFGHRSCCWPGPGWACAPR
jgi:inner membrane transporter RhtA